MTDNTGIVVAGHSSAWRVRKAFTTVQRAPFVTVPQSGAVVDPVDVEFLYGWDDTNRAWFVLSIVVDGRKRDDDGTYADNDYVTVDYYDPVYGDEGSEGKAPSWLLSWARQAMSDLPVPPPLPRTEGESGEH